MMEVRLLGPVEVVGPEGPVDVGGARPGRVLVALFVAERQRLDLDALVDRCFDDDDRPDDPVPAIRTAVRRLRRALGDDTIATRPGGYELDLRTLDVDVDRFDELVTAGRAASDPVAAITSFHRALDLWRGRPFGELGDLDWLAPERTRLEEAHLAALEGWHDSHLRNGTATEIIPSLESATLEHPLRERFHRQLMQALFVADRQADALRAFQTYREAMAEAGLEPGPETIELERRIATGDQSLRTQTEGRPLRGYRIVERLGEGAFSIVYRGTQPSVDREVAIKQIRAELANRPEFIRRFEAEARMVAHLEHPFIVPLYDYWREPGSAYLVMRLLPGGNLESSLLDGPWSVERTARMIEQVGAALSAAHRAGVVHRDVKPANILLDDEGNSYLTDFGIALADAELVDPEASLSAGSPAYASPEQLRREPVGPSADVHGLVIAVYEALTGRLPFPDEPTQAALLQRQLNDPIPSVRSSRVDVPAGVDDVIQRATAKRSGDRYQTVEEFIAAFEMAIGESVVAPVRGIATMVPTDERNPYKGLRAFDEGDAADFTGRERLVDQLVAELGSNRMLAVVGPSGSGKSSVVRAGLLPALRRGAVPGSADWFVATLLPGEHPDEELEATLLRVAAERPPGLLDVIRDGDRGITRALRQVLPETGQLLLVIDQFEELFTLCDDESARRRFLDGLAAAVTEERSRLHVVLTLRADFFDRPLRYESIGRLVRDGTVPVLPLAADELERAIVEPAHSVGAEFEPGLVSEIVADVADQPGALPLLQYALTELYERRISNLLTRDAYRAIGGVTGALAATAEERFESLNPGEREVARRLFGRLVTLGEGVEDTRRRVTRSELGESAHVDAVIDRFGRARLLSFDRDPVTREPTIEVGHEALLREWPRVRAWLDDDRDGLRIHRHLTETSAAWAASGRDDGELYRGARLEAASAWAHDHGDDLNEAEREFLAASVAQRRAEEAAEQAHAEHQARSNRRLRVLVAVATVIAFIAATAGVVAFQQRSRADDEAAEAERQSEEAQRQASEAAAAEQDALDASAEAEDRAVEAEAANERARASEALAVEQRDRALSAEAAADFDRLVALARTTEAADPTVGLLLGIEAYRFWSDAESGSPGTRSTTSDVEALDALHRALTARNGFLGWLGSEQVGQMSVLDDGERFVVNTATTIDVWNVASREREASWPFPSVADSDADLVFLSISATPDGAFVAASEPTGATVLDLATGEAVMRIDRTSAFSPVALSPDGKRLAVGYDNGLAEVWDVGEPAGPVATIERTEQVSDVEWSPDGNLLAVGFNDGGFLLFDRGNDNVRWESGPVADAAPDNAALGFLFSTAIDRLVVSTQTSTEAVATGRPTGIRALRVADVATGADVIEPIKDAANRSSISWFDAQEQVVVASPSSASDVTVFDVSASTADRAEPRQLGEAKGSSSWGMAVFPELGVVVTGGSSGIELRSMYGAGPLTESTSLAVAQREVTNSRVLFIGAFSPDNGQFVTSMVPPVALPHVTDLERPWLTPTPFAPVDDQGPSVIVDQYGEHTLHALPAWFVVREGVDGPALGPPIPYDPTTLGSVALSPQGDRLMLDEGEQVVLYDVASGEPIRTLDIPFAEVLFTNGKFSRDGSTLNVTTYLASASFDADTGERLWANEQLAFAFPLDDGSTVVSGDGLNDDVIRLRETEMFDEIADPLLGHQSGISWINLHPSLPRLATTGRDGTIRVWDLDTSVQLGRALPSRQAGVGIWSPDGTLLAVPRPTGYDIWNYDTDTWADIACEVAGRNLTRAEWEEFGPRTIEYRPTCDQYPTEE